MLNAFSVDLEDWFHLLDVGPLRTDEWASYESRVWANTERILRLLAEHDTRATFFVLGWIAEKHPDLIRHIADLGHEIGSHGYAHLLTWQVTPSEFEADLARSIEVIGKVSGQPVDSYRAPGFSITSRTPWAWEILSRNGIGLDSSVFPAIRAHGGIRNATAEPHRIETPHEPIVEFPITTLGSRWWAFAFCGGGYLRLLPSWLVISGVRWVNQRKSLPAVVYLHPRDLDPDQPRLSLPQPRYARSYIGLASAENKVRKLLSSFEFGTLTESLRAYETCTGRPPGNRGVPRRPLPGEAAKPR